MNHIFLTFKRSISKNGKKYLIINFLSIIIFAFLYYINDYFIINNIELAKKIKLIENDYNIQNNIQNNNSTNKLNLILYYIWFSLITQTTIGYNGFIDPNNGVNIPFILIKNNSYKIINIMQIISIFIYASIFI